MSQMPAAFTPNSQQKAVFDWAVSSTGSLNLHACAGTGKTTTLIQLMRYLEGSVYFGAFNKAIAGEIDARIKEAPGLDLSRITVSTIHSAGMRAWRKHNPGFSLKVEKNKIRNIIDELAQQHPQYSTHESFLRRAVDYAKQFGFGPLTRIKDWDNWQELIQHYSLESEVKSDNPDWDELIAMAIKIYDESLKCCRHEIDFADMLLAPLINNVRFPKHDWILIDEAQDISPVRLAIICRMVKPSTRVIAVGDPHQAIYGFTGADSQSLNTIAERFSSITLPLSVTYRCPKVVVEMAQQWVPEITAHPDSPMGNRLTVWLKPKKAKQAPVLGNGDEGDSTIATEIPQTDFWESAPFTKHDAILCRNTKPLVELAYQFLRKQIPAYVEGKDIGRGMINLATRWKITELDRLEVRLEEHRTREVRKFLEMKQEGRAALIEDQIDTLLVLICATQEQGGTTVEQLISLIDRMFGDTPDGEKPSCLVLSTIHKSKGREWPRVFILGRARYMPSKWARKDWELEQERNLAYVAVTRAKSTLVDIIVPD